MPQKSRNMPRLPPKLLVASYRENPLLTLLLKECHSLHSARNELRWLREHALRESNSAHATWQTRLKAMCRQRSKGVPLQYILGDQPFGDLEILCKRGVLIPRADTESYTFEAAKLVQQLAMERADEHRLLGISKPGLRILDLCTGTGCISLLLHALLAPRVEDLQILGVDISPRALNLTQENLRHNTDRGLLDRRALSEVKFRQANILGSAKGSPIPNIEEIIPKWSSSLKPSASVSPMEGCDLLISNPPYISNADFRNGTTSRSVRLFEPRLALVPPKSHHTPLEEFKPEDIFYYHILQQSLRLKAKITVLECGDIRQAQRVVDMHHSLASECAGDFEADIWPITEQDLAANGFHPRDGSRGVIIQRRG